MKNRLAVIMFLFVSIVPVALFARDNANNANAQHGGTQLSVIAVEHPDFTAQPTSPVVVAGEKQTPLDYDAAMLAITQRFSATLATIADAVQQGKLSSDQAKEMSAEQYQVTQMQLELLSLWREIEKQDLAKIPDIQASPTPTQGNDIVMVALPFSSLQINPSLADYLGLTPSQVEAIQHVMSRERHSLEPLMVQLRDTRERLFGVGSDHMSERQVKDLARAEAALLARLIVANARMQSKIYKALSPEQQKKLSDLERTQGAATVESQ